MARFSGGFALLGHFDAVIEAVAHDVHKRLSERRDDRLVGGRVFALHLKLDLLFELAGEVANEPREPVERLRDRLHAHGHDGRLHFLREPVDHAVLILDFARHFAGTESVLGAAGEEREAVL